MTSVLTLALEIPNPMGTVPKESAFEISQMFDCRADLKGQWQRSRVIKRHKWLQKEKNCFLNVRLECLNERVKITMYWVEPTTEKSISSSHEPDLIHMPADRTCKEVLFK